MNKYVNKKRTVCFVGLISIEILVLLYFAIMRPEFSLFGSLRCPDAMHQILPASLSVVFLSTSMISILTDKSERIYWEYYSESLIKQIPGFVFSSSFGFVSSILQVIFYILFLNRVLVSFSQMGFFISFINGLIAIIFLFYLGTGVYFRRSSLLKHMRDRFENTEPKGELSMYLGTAGAFSRDISEGRERTAKENLLFLIDYFEKVSQSISREERSKIIRQMTVHLRNAYESDGALFATTIDECFSKIPEEKYNLLMYTLYWYKNVTVSGYVKETLFELLKKLIKNS